MNIYKKTFEVNCPNDNANIVYKLTIKSMEVIMVEDINKELDYLKTSFQENIADLLSSKFNGEIKIIGTHQNVKVITLR